MPSTILFFIILCAVSQDLDDDQFVDAFVDNTTPFVNEQVTYTFRYYYQNILPTLEQPEYCPPLFTGFLKKRLASTNIKFQVVDGITYRVEEIKTALFPVSAGKHEIEPASLYIPAFSASFDQPKTLTTHSIELNVKPLPEEGKPVDFSGAVGKYQIRAKIDSTTVPVGQPVALVIVLSGTGCIETCVKPIIPEIESFKIFKPTEKMSIFDEPPKLKGDIRWEYVLIAKKAGNYTIPSIQYNYFNPETKIYELTQTRPISIAIEPGPNGSSRGDTVPARTTNEPDRSTNEPTAHSTNDRDDHFYQYVYFWLIVILPVLIAVGMIIFKRRVRQIKNDPNYMRKNAAKVAEKRLKQMENSINSKDPAQLSTELVKTIREYISIRFDIPAVELNADQISSKMIGAGYSAEVVTRLIEVLKQCDYARFAPVAVDSEKMRKAVQSARDAIRRIADR